MSRSKLLGWSLIALLFTAAAPALAGEPGTPAAPAPNAAAAVPATCGPSLPALGQTIQGATCAAQPESKLPDFLTTSKRLGYCHCGCVAQRTCRTSEDCGGASCDPVISCC